MQAYIGVIMLAGIVVSNAILLVDYINTLRRRDGMPLREAVELGGRTRLRPILMTSIATMLGLVPMAIGLGEGGELQAPLARVVIGGLLASTMVTLVLVPVVYTLFEEGWQRHVPPPRGASRVALTGDRLIGSTAAARHMAPAAVLCTHPARAHRYTKPGRHTPRVIREGGEQLRDGQPVPDRASRAQSPPAAPARTAARGTAGAERSDRGSSMTASPYRIRSRSSVRGAPGCGRSRPKCCSMASSRVRSARGRVTSRRRRRAFRKRGCGADADRRRVVERGDAEIDR